MKTTISTTKVIETTVEIEFPAYFKVIELNMFHCFKSPEQESFCVYNMPGNYKTENKGVSLTHVISSDNYEPCTAEIFYENYAASRFALDTILDFQQLFLTDNTPEND